MVSHGVAALDRQGFEGKGPPGPFLEPISMLEIGTRGLGGSPEYNLSAVSPRELCPGVTSPAATVRQRLPAGPFDQANQRARNRPVRIGGASAHEPLSGGADGPELEKHWRRQ
ncbi:hypothetical protein M514_12769 [Trichuris suis]|uniref:Uncharacterized protein n=1 Tax=Trichuris suis TaxID=68888 RepID=A0A085LN07_9BILA|nr:hypothetical protein M513_12769 [Trichuris suis]KFD62904.1 hypothetical protein M514_12769 [Trichuris suis]